MFKKGFKHSEETKKKISEFQKNFKENPTRFKKGNLHPYFGKHSPSFQKHWKWKLSDRKKIKGRKFTEEHRKNLSESCKGRIISKKQKNKISNTLKGRKLTKNHRKNIALGMEKDKHWNWQGGKSFEPYGLEFNEDLKEVIRNRDRRKCQICEKTELEEGKKLSIHHIDYCKQNNNPNNLISLCATCHMKTNFNRNYWQDYFSKNMTITQAD